MTPYDEDKEIVKGFVADGHELLDELEPTRPRKISPRSPFAVLPDIPALEALVHVSVMLKSAEEVSDEITEMASGIERGLVWSLVHSVEMARSLVDALLQGNGVDPEQLQRPG